MTPTGAQYASIPFIPTFSYLASSLSLSDLEWLWNQDASRDLLLAVHPPNYIVLWNGDTGTKLWKKSYAENILSFSFDPFDPSNMACRWSTTSIWINCSLISCLNFLPILNVSMQYKIVNRMPAYLITLITGTVTLREMINSVMQTAEPLISSYC